MKVVNIGDTKLVQGKHDTVFISRRSSLSNKQHTVCIAGTTIEALELYLTGEDPRLVQDAFPLLSESDREFVMTGITEEEWNRAFPPEKEDE